MSILEPCFLCQGKGGNCPQCYGTGFSLVPMKKPSESDARVESKEPQDKDTKGIKV